MLLRRGFNLDQPLRLKEVAPVSDRQAGRIRVCRERSISAIKKGRRAKDATKLAEAIAPVEEGRHR